MNVLFKRKLLTPQEVIKTYPLSREAKEQKKANDEEIRAALTGKSGKFLLIVGPCSADREDCVLEYVTALAKIYEKVRDKIVVVPRVYTNKPRTTGAGYKGMLHQSDPSREPDMFRGLISIRRLHIRCLEESGFSGADEMLYPENQRYLADVLSYVSVGARSVENQQHRLTASALDVPVGFKNPTSGDLSVMLNAVAAARIPHDFAYDGWEVESFGNPYAHAVLRGYVDKHGKNFPNYGTEDLEELCRLSEEKNVPLPPVIIDVNHSNSDKNAQEQPRIAMEILENARKNPMIAKLVKGLMIESYIEDGSQPIGGTIYGQSITDACLSLKKTEKLIYEIADKLP